MSKSTQYWIQIRYYEEDLVKLEKTQNTVKSTVDFWDLNNCELSEYLDVYDY